MAQLEGFLVLIGYIFFIHCQKIHSQNNEKVMFLVLKFTLQILLYCFILICEILVYSKSDSTSKNFFLIFFNENSVKIMKNAFFFKL